MILVSGASGFIGQHLVCRDRTARFIGFDRSLFSSYCSNEIDFSTSNFCSQNRLLSCADNVIHLAGVAHCNSYSKSYFNDVNVFGTINFAKHAAINKVKRFIFISSIGVNGSVSSTPFTEKNFPNPSNDYAYSKWKAEEGLHKVSALTGMEVVIIRPPLVYGKNAPGNFGKLINLFHKGIPLPFGSVNNKRSLVSIDNLVDFIITCVDHPAAANQTFLAADGEALSTTELFHAVAHAMGKSPRLIPIPISLLEFGARLLGKEAMAQSLLGTLQVDIGKAKNLLGWQPQISVEEGLRRCF